MGICQGRWGWAAALVAVALAAGCGDEVRLVEAPPDGASGLLPGTDTATPPPADTAAPPAPDTTTPPADVGPTPGAPPRFVFEEVSGADGAACASTCLLAVEAGATAPLAVRYVDGVGAPIPGAEIRFHTDAGPDLAKLTSLSTYTDDAGRAQVDLKAAPGARSTVAVTASVAGASAPPDLTFLVRIDPPEVPDLRVSFTYLGPQPLEHFQVRLHGPTAAPSCAAVHPVTAPAPPVPALTSGPLATTQAGVFDALPAPAEGAEAAWTIQVVGPFGAPATAVGCTSGVGLLDGATREVTVNVTDLPVTWSGTYAVETSLDLVSGLEGTAASPAATVLELFSHPGKVTLLAACDDASGTLGTLCDFLVSDGQPSLMGAVIVDAADAAFVELMADNLGGPIVFGAQSLDEMLRHARLDGTLTLTAEPQAPTPGEKLMHLPPGAASDAWSHARFTWVDENACAGGASGCTPPDVEITLDLAALYGAAPAGKPAASVDGLGRLHLAPHSASGLHYGPLVNALVEAELLPRLFGDGANGLPPVDSYDALAATLFGDKYCLYYDDCCDYFTWKIQDDLPSWALPLAPTACELAIPAAAAWVRDLLVGLEGELVLATPANAPCPGAPAEGTLQVTRLGSKKAPCAWDATFPVGTPPFHPAGSWYAELAP